MLKKIGVRLGGRSYPILIGGDSLSRLGDLAARFRLKGTACVVTQKAVWAHWAPKVKESLARAGFGLKLHLPSRSVKKSEQMKTVSEFLRLIETLAGADGKGKGVFAVALGGGVVGDLAGFASAVYRRGIPYIQVPTTLTAQVDSAIGGKTAVDLPQGKNLLGAIHQPRFVLSDPAVLRTLPGDIFRDGLAEVVKSALIRDPGLFRYLEKHRQLILSRSPRHLADIIAACARIKADVVSRDEFDKKDVRIILNFGHTIGHALEAASGYSGYTHGQAVSIGMICALGLSRTLGVLRDPPLVRRCQALLLGFGLPVTINRKVNPAAVLKAVGYDKKNVDGKNRFVLISDLGRTVIREGIQAETIRQELLKRRA